MVDTTLFQIVKKTETVIKSFIPLLVITLLISPIRADELTQDLGPFTKQLLKKYRLDKNNLSFVISEIDKKEYIQQFRPNEEMVPASVAKIFATFYGLKVLGPDFKFQTLLKSSAPIEDGILKGDIYLKGMGDPSLKNDHLFNMVLQLKAKGITKIEGNFYYDDYLYPSIEKISDLGLGDQTYNPGLSALSSEFNRIRLWRFGKYRTTWKNRFEEIPSLETFKIQNTKEKFVLGKRFNLIEATNSNETWQVSNHLRYKTISEIPIRNPGLWTASLFHLMAKREGITLPLPNRSEVPKNQILNTLALNQSESLINLAKLTHEYSNNLFAEAIVIAAHLQRGQTIKTLEDVPSQMKIWYKKQYSSLNWDSFNFRNSSGLSSQSTIKSQLITDFLKVVAQERFGPHFFRSTFSISGQSGWLRRRMNTPELSHRVWAKTGALDYVTTLGGYFYSKTGKNYAFTLLINDSQKRIDSDEASERKRFKLKNKAMKWRHRSQDFMDELIEHWINTY